MSSPGAGASRLLRGAWLSGLTIALSAVAHGLGGGHLPPVEMQAGLAALLLPVCVWVAGRQVRPPAAVALLAVGQLALHGAYSILMACPTPGGGQAGLTIAGHAGHGATEMAVHCATAGAPGRQVLGGASMLAFHAVATVATAVAVGGAERLIWWVRDELAVRPAPPHPAPVVMGPEPAPAPWRVAGPAPAMYLRARPTHRGPPPAFRALGALPS